MGLRLVCYGRIKYRMRRRVCQVTSLVESPLSRRTVVFGSGGPLVGSVGLSSGGGGRLCRESGGLCVGEVFGVGLRARAMRLGPRCVSSVWSASWRSRHRGLVFALVLEYGCSGGGGGLWRPGGLGRRELGREGWGSLGVCC